MAFLGYQALRPQHHHDHEQEAEDAEAQLREVEVQPDLARDVVEHVRYQPVVDERQRDRPEHDPPDRAEPAEDDHREHEDRERELELVGVDRAEERAEERAGHAAAGRAHRVGEQLHAHGRDAHRDRGDLVLADRDPRPPDARVAQAEVDEQDDQRERERGPVPRVSGSAW